MTKRVQGYSGQSVNNTVDLKFIRIGETKRTDVLQNLHWADSGIKDERLFWGRWISSGSGVVWAVGEVVFDDGHSDKSYLERGYKFYCSRHPNTALPAVPLFKEDKSLQPLQAAHHYAWLVSKSLNEQYESNELRTIEENFPIAAAMLDRENIERYLAAFSEKEKNLPDEIPQRLHA